MTALLTARPLVRIRTTLILLGVTLGTGGGCVLSGTTKTTVPRVEQQLDQALPVGSTRAEVEAWLKAKGLESSYKTPLDDYYDSTVNEAVPDVRAYQGITHAVIENTDRSIFVTGSIHLYFLYGPNDRLAKRIVS